MNQRIKSLSGRGSPGFLSVRAAGQTAFAYPRELGRTAANCNPNCNPEDMDDALLPELQVSVSYVRAMHGTR